MLAGYLAQAQPKDRIKPDGGLRLEEGVIEEVQGGPGAANERLGEMQVGVRHEDEAYMDRIVRVWVLGNEQFPELLRAEDQLRLAASCRFGERWRVSTPLPSNSIS